ncbi:MAG: hypothetical protein EXS64_00490 [Candidatus Latescibacteria bacterium]|nr:hypothetical protein [Candidatus Latescibacterota bacterium]
MVQVGIPSGRDAETIIARCRALGVNRVALYCATFRAEGEEDVPDLDRLREAVARLSGAGIAVPAMIKWFGGDPAVVLDRTGHRREIDAMRRTISAIGRAGIPSLLHYVDLAEPPDPSDDAAYWDGLIAVLREIVPEAEQADVRLAHHGIWRCLPDDLRTSALRSGVKATDYRQYRPEGWGGPYLVRDAEGIQRLLDAAPSPYNGVAFCTGMHITGGDVPSLVAQFRGKIHFAQARDVRGRWPAAEEVFPGEGELDFPHILRLLREAGYEGMIHAEHLGHPRGPGDDLEARAVAYLKTAMG